jgi:spore germination protein GerM
MTRALAAALLALAMASCGGQPSIHLLSDRELPEDLYGISTQPSLEERTVQTVLYFVHVDRRGLPTNLGATNRQQPTRLRTVELVMRQLLGGPTPQEIGRGLRTAIPAETNLLNVSVADGVATVNLSAPFEAAGPESLHLLRVAQVVFTLAELPNVDSVRFRIHGVPQPVVDQRGVAHDKVGPARYSDFAPTEQQAPPVADGPLAPDTAPGSTP